MTAGKRRAKPLTISAWQRGRHTGAVRGPMRVLHPTIKRLDLPYQWDAKAGVYLVPLPRLDDLLAAVELDGHRVEYLAAGR